MSAVLVINETVSYNRGSLSTSSGSSFFLEIRKIDRLPRARIIIDRVYIIFGTFLTTSESRLNNISVVDPFYTLKVGDKLLGFAR